MLTCTPFHLPSDRPGYLLLRAIPNAAYHNALKDVGRVKEKTIKEDGEEPQ